MSVIRNLIIFCGLLIFAVGANAISNNAVAMKKAPAVNKEVVTEAANEVVDINSADVKTFKTIKGFGKKKAEAVIEYRTKNGSFKSVDDLLKVKCRGLNQKWLDKVKKFLKV
jgi:competence protein ComEA